MTGWINNKKEKIAEEKLPLSNSFSADNSQGQDKKRTTQTTSKGLLQRKKEEQVSEKIYFTRL